MDRHDLIVACLLEPDLVRERVHQWRELVGQASDRRTTGSGVELRLPVDLAAATAELARAEHECCPFFGFVLRIDERGLSLEVTAPPEARALVDVLLTLDGPDA